MPPATASPGLSSPSLAPATPDKRLRIIDRTMRLHGYASHALIETLHAAYAMAKNNDGAPGVDGVTFAAIERQGVEAFLGQIRDELVRHT